MSRHEPLKVTRRVGDDFVVMAADDWERQQETLYALQSHNLMQQIADSLQTYAQQSGYRPTTEQFSEVTDL